MSPGKKKSAIAAAILLLLLLIPKNNPNLMKSISTIFRAFIPVWEGFLAYPKWDVRQWTWGYGTAAGFDPNNKPAGTIDKIKAMSEALAYASKDLMELLPQINKPLTASQWVALLSFSFNLGIGNALKLLPNINAGNQAALETQWKAYNKVRDAQNNLVVSDYQTKRRAAEWALWLK